MSKPKQAGWCAANGEILSISGKKRWLTLGESLRKRAACFDEPLIRFTDHEAAIAELQEDRDQQYDMKVNSREQRDAMTAERNELLGLLDDSRDAVCEALNGASNERAAEAYAALLARIDATLEPRKC